VTPLERCQEAIRKSKVQCGAEIQRARARHSRRVSGAFIQLGKELAAEAAGKSDDEIVS